MSGVSVETRFASLLKDTGNSKCEEGGFCLFIFGNGFVGIPDLSLTGIQSDITSCTQILALCCSGNSLETEAFIFRKIGEGSIDECSEQEGSCLRNLSVLNLNMSTHGLLSSCMHFFILWDIKLNIFIIMYSVKSLGVQEIGIFLLYRVLQIK